MRCIDADALIKKLFPYDVVDKKDYTINAKAVADAIANIPTADVVPKSEVDEIAEELSDTIVMKDELFDEVIKLRYELANAKAKVAREIFESIEECIYLYYNKNDYTMPNIEEDIAELKKKYAE